MFSKLFNKIKEWFIYVFIRSSEEFFNKYGVSEISIKDDIKYLTYKNLVWELVDDEEGPYAEFVTSEGLREEYKEISVSLEDPSFIYHWEEPQAGLLFYSIDVDGQTNYTFDECWRDEVPEILNNR